jgi:hypothetical protein
MKVLIENERIVIGVDALEYYPYYFCVWAEEGNHRLVVKNVLSQWALALARLNGEVQAVYLPYYLDDQVCKVLKATLEGEVVVFINLDIWENAYALDLDHLDEFMVTEPKIMKANLQEFGHYKREEVISALNHAEVVGD